MHIKNNNSQEISGCFRLWSSKSHQVYKEPLEAPDVAFYFTSFAFVLLALVDCASSG